MKLYWRHRNKFTHWWTSEFLIGSQKYILEEDRIFSKWCLSNCMPAYRSMQIHKYHIYKTQLRMGQRPQHKTWLTESDRREPNLGYPWIHWDRRFSHRDKQSMVSIKTEKLLHSKGQSHNLWSLQKAKLNNPIKNEVQV